MDARIVANNLQFTSFALDSAGTVAQKLDYLPFGQERVNVQSGSFETRFTFTDQERDDESGLLYYGARYYHPTLGRFTQPDPVITDIGRKEFAMAMMSPQLLNGYSYVGNNPMKHVDKQGEFLVLAPIIGYAPVWIPATITAIGAVGGSIAAWYYGGALGYYAEKDYASGDASLDTSIFVSTTTAEVAGGLVVIGDAFGAGGNSGQNNNRNTTQQTQGTKNSLPDSALCVRGGQCTAEQFRNASGVTYNKQTNTLEDGVSVNSAPNKSVEELSKGIKNGQIGVTTVGDVRKAGGDVIPSQSGQNPNHATLQGITPEQAQKSFQPTRPNPTRVKRK
ncbi:MAG TPA: hypothetical protein DEP11_05125 [Candidatus Jacksonbacteria bacterium]|nr:hypothetical protein [Candidatus Jacksonbacteria bacterium]